MKNLCKKLLACCLAVCMVLTLCVGALTVGAEVTDNYVKVGTVDITTDAETATVPVTILSTGGIAAAEINVSVPADLDIVGMALETTDAKVEVTYASEADPTGEPVVLDAQETSSDVAPQLIDNVLTYIVHLPAKTVTTAAVTLNITFAGTFVEGAYEVAVADAEACYDENSDLIDLTFEAGAINVKAAHVCEFVGTVTKAATCTEPGIKTFACTCGEGTYTEEIPVIPHTEETIPAVDATCTAAGATAGVKCSVCGTVLTAPTATDALGHKYEKVVTDPTCTTAGYTTYTCSVCGDTYKADEVDALGHDYKEEVTTAPTCTEKGVKTFTCSNCGDTYTQAIDALGHEEVDVDAVAPTCTETGLTAGKKCSVCGAFTVPQDVVDALGHKYEKVVTDPTCTTAGYTTYTCSVCGDTYKADDVDALGHKYEKVVTDPTCTTAGYTTYTCSVCGDTYKADDVDALGHTEEAIPAVPATCTTPGSTAGVKCSVCQEVLEAPKAIEALGHNFGDNLEFCANNCGTENPDYVAPCDHDWVMTEVVDATAETEGWIIYECSKCDVEPKVETVMYWSRHTFYKRNINMASQIELNFKIREDRFNDSTLGNATEAFAKITVNTDFGEETSYVTGLENYAVTVNPGDSRNIRTVVVALAAKQMMDEVTANTFIKVGNQWYSGAAKTETVEGLAQGIYDDIGETERTLYANLLTYGARAQEYFNYKADTLADANLGNYASYVTSAPLTFDGSIEQTYSTDDAEGDSSIRTYKYGLTMAAKTEANLRVRLDKYVPFPDINTVTATLTYGVGEDVIVTNVASSEFSFFESNSSGDRYTFSYADVYPKCMRDDVTLIFYVNGVATDNVVTFSIENIVSKVYGNSTATEQAMYQAMMHYADAAKAHFG